MPKETLKQALDIVRREIAEGSEDLSPHLKELLETVRGDIDASLLRLEAPAEDTPSTNPEERIADRMRLAVDEFEGAHPTLTEVIGRVADALSSMGI